jgi:transposase
MMEQGRRWIESKAHPAEIVKLMADYGRCRTQKEVAARLGVSITTIQNWLHNGQSMSLPIRKLVAEILGVP